MDIHSFSNIFTNFLDSRHKIRNKRQFHRINHYFSIHSYFSICATDLLQGNTNWKWQYLGEMVLIFQLYETFVNCSDINTGKIIINRSNNCKIFRIWPISLLCFTTFVERRLHVPNNRTYIVRIRRSNCYCDIFNVFIWCHWSDEIWTRFYWFSSNFVPWSYDFHYQNYRTDVLWKETWSSY